MEPLTQLKLFLDLAALIVGAMFGSFLNVVIYRVPRRQSIVWPASRCLHCGAPIRAYDNIPILSFLLLKGRCRTCQVPISYQYPLVEAANALLYLLCMHRFGLAPFLPFACVAASMLLAVSVIDIRLRIIPDVISLPGTMIALLIPAALDLAHKAEWWPVTLFESLLGYFVGAGSLLAVSVGYLIVTGREGMGFGDVKLMGFVGAALGWQKALLAILIGSVSGTLLAIPMIIFAGGSRRTVIPFGPYLSLGALIVMLYGDALIEWYLSVMGVNYPV